MKPVLTLLFLLAFSLLHAQVKTPAPSPMCKTTQTVGLTDISLEFSRPGVKDRTIFGGLVPFGEVWRTGANACTKISFSDDVRIDGHALKAGQYALYTIPGEQEWEVIFYSDVSAWGLPEEWKEDLVAVRIRVAPVALAHTVQNMLLWIDNITNDRASLLLMWDRTLVPLTIDVPTEELVMKTIHRTLDGPTANDYYAAGRYYFESGKDKNQALDYVRKANTMDARYWTLRMESLILADMGQTREAIAVAEKSLAKAREAGNADYIRMNEASIAEWGGK